MGQFQPFLSRNILKKRRFNLKKISSIVLRISITLFLLIFLFRKTDIAGLSGIVRQTDVWRLAQAFALFLFLNFLILLRWQALLQGLSIRVRLSRIFITYLSSLFFNLVLPSTIGGDTVRTIDMARHTAHASSGVLATVVLDRVAGFFGLMTVLVVALFFGYRILNDPAIIVVAFILLGIILFLTGIAFWGRFFNFIFRHVPFERLRKYLYKIHDATASFKEHRGVLFYVWFLSCIVQAGLPIMYYLASEAVGAHVSLAYFFIFVPVITAFSVIPVSIGGLGVRDTACVALFAKAGMAAEKAFVLSLINFGFIFVVGVFGGLMYVFSLYRRRV